MVEEEGWVEWERVGWVGMVGDDDSEDLAGSWQVWRLSVEAGAVAVLLLLVMMENFKWNYTVGFASLL